MDFKNDMYPVFEHMSKVNLLSLNFDETHYIQFITKSSFFIDMIIGYDNKIIANVLNTKFRGVVTDNTSLWEILTEHIIPELSAACYAVRFIKPYISHETLLIVYYSHFNSIMTCRLICWGNSLYSIKVFSI
jgi:hypothetical protein